MYVKVENGVGTEYTLRQLKQDNPNTSFPPKPSDELLAGFDIYPVLLTDPPALDEATQKAVAADPAYLDPYWVQQWDIVAKTTAEQDAYASETARQEDIALLKADSQVLALLRARPAGINNYVDNNVTDLDSAKDLLKILSRAVAVLAHTVVN